MDWDAPAIEALITSALAEDVGSGDVSVAATVPAGAVTTACLVTLHEIVCAGLPLAERIFRWLDADASVELHSRDGQTVVRDTVLISLNGNAGAILTGEQTALNLLSRLCGIATTTREYVQRVAGTRAKVRDTRSTTPALRRLEQYAIRMGGGTHHHEGLYDAIVLTRAHIAAAGGIKPALDQAHSHASRLLNPGEISAYEATGTLPDETGAGTLSIQIEIRNETDLREALSAGAESILLTDVAPRKASELVAVARSVRADCVMEFSGDIPLAEARAYAGTGVDYLSPRALTAAAPWARLRLLVDSPREK